MMLPWEQGTTLDTNIKNALQFCGRIILVIGYRGNELHERYVNRSNITITHNPDYAQGLLTPVKATIPAVQTKYCFLTRGGMPTLTIGIFRKAWSSRNDGAILPLHNGTPSHPTLVSKPCLIQTIWRLNVTNMHQVLLTRDHCLVEIENTEIISDIDTPNGFTIAKGRYTKIQKAQLSDCTQVFNLSGTYYHDGKESPILRKEEN